MAQLFKKNVLKDKLQNYEIQNFEEKIKIIENWNNLYVSWNLQNKKEEELEAPFWDDFFWKILWYETLAQNELYNRKFQPKVPEWWQKADLWLGFFSSVEDTMKVVIELKDAKTSLDKPQQRAWNLTPIQQAFKYKPYFKEVDFIIVSNFYETRLYIDSYYDYESFTLPDLVNPTDNYFNFRKFYYLLNKDNLISKKGESNTKSLLSLIRIKEKEITKQFYKEYTILRKELFKDIVVNNPWFKKTELDFLLNKTQKIIDRIIFVHFCEDLWLLPQWKLKENILRAEELDFTPWEVLKKFFKWVDSWSEKLGIPDWYNWWLFHEDIELNNLKVWNEICKKFVDLWEYDFADDLTVNILWHIFEQSISDIEELKDKINKQEEATLSKRKKDWVFYTPEYIVDYIVKNSVGKKIDEWEEELKEKHFLKDDINDKNYTKRAISVYQDLQIKVQEIKVLDPACWSGAFLVKVFDFLLEKNKEISKKLEDLWVNQGLFSSDSYFKSILQNNIYWVDLNEESVEITKLSLWLKTASKGKKLANLDKNIKCWNSLIDDKIAGDKAFVWETEFGEIFANWGFDVIVGNPPYVRWTILWKKDKDFFSNKYISAKWQFDLYFLFYEKSFSILNKEWKLWFITPIWFLNSKSGLLLRKKLISEVKIDRILDISNEEIFEWVWTYPIIFIYSLSWTNWNIEIWNLDNVSGKSYNFKKLLQNNISNNENYDININLWNEDIKIFNRLEEKETTNKLSEISINFRWMQINKVKVLKNIDIDDFKWNDNLFKGVHLKDVKKWIVKDWENYVLHNEIIAWNGKKELFNKEKILIPRFVLNFQWTYDEKSYILDNIYIILLNDNSNINTKYLLSLFNSKLFDYYYSKKFSQNHISWWYFAINWTQLDNLSIKNISLSQQQPFIQKADFMLENNKILQEKTNKFLNRLKTSFWIEKLSWKLEKFYDLDFGSFVNELKKNKINLSLKDQDEWEDYFASYKNEILELKNAIEKCDMEIDDMVFDLYGLDEEERRVVLGIN